MTFLQVRRIMKLNSTSEMSDDITFSELATRGGRMVLASPESDPTALLACPRGDAEALGKLLEVYRQYLSLLARTQIGRRLQGKADPSDLVQEVCLEAHRHIADFRGQTSGNLPLGSV